MALILRKFLTVCKCFGPLVKISVHCCSSALNWRWIDQEEKTETHRSHIPILLHLSHLHQNGSKVKAQICVFQKSLEEEASRFELQQTSCSWRKEKKENRKRVCDSPDDEGKKDGPVTKRGEKKIVVWSPNLHSPLTSWSSSVILEEEIWRLQKENENKEETIIELRVGEERRKILERELNTRQEEVIHLKKDLVLLKQKVQQLSGIKQSFTAC